MKVCIIIITHLIQYIVFIYMHNSEPGIYVWVSTIANLLIAVYFPRIQRFGEQDCEPDQS